MVKFFTDKAYKDQIKQTAIHILLTEEIFERICPKEYKKMVYLAGLFDVDGKDFFTLFKYGTGNAGQYTEESRYDNMKKLEDAIYKLEAAIEPIFGMLKCDMINGCDTPVLYTDYRASRNSNYATYGVGASYIPFT